MFQLYLCLKCPCRLFEDGRCVTHCQAGRFAMGKQCLLCHHTCKACTDEGPDNCTSCGTDRFGLPRYLFQDQCREACPEGFFHSAMMRCEPCAAKCINCVAADRCVQCSPEYKIQNGHCVQLKCSTDEVSDAEEEDCLPCDEGCNKCKR
ncbi:hypothetical protein ATANTOWER_003600, partial [Ataeniobius toweri]|nr:hypothetical protein [Ataeniobius toweri]